MTLTSPLKDEISGNSIIRKRNGAGGNIELVRANGSDLFLGALVSYYGETAGDPDVDLSAAGAPVDGVIIGPAYDAIDLDKDSDDTFDDNTWLLMYKPVSGDELYLTMATNTSGTYGEWQTHAGGFVNGDFAYSDGTHATDLMEDVIGTLQETISSTAATEKVCVIKWGSP